MNSTYLQQLKSVECIAINRNKIKIGQAWNQTIVYAINQNDKILNLPCRDNQIEDALSE